MDALLIGGWLAGLDPIRVIDEGSVAEVRAAVREAGAASGIPTVAVERLTAAASELAHNQVRHAKGGEVALRRLERGGVAGLEVIAADRGPGIGAPAAAMSRRVSDGFADGSLGVGLGAARRLSDEMDVDLRLEEGSCIAVRVFADAVPRQREVAVLGRPYPGERASGDGAAWVRHGARLTLGVIDGVGHGPHARAAALTAAEVLGRRAAGGPAAVLEACHEALAGGRGAAMAVIELDEGSGELVHASVGNITLRICGARGSRGHAAVARVLGSPGALAIREERDAVAFGEAIVLFSDGLASRAQIDDPALLRDHPIVAAQRLLERFDRGRDDALVAVVR